MLLTVPHLHRQVAVHSTEMGVQEHSGEQAHPGAGVQPGRRTSESLQPGSGASWSLDSHRWGLLGGCMAQMSQLKVNMKNY